MKDFKVFIVEDNEAYFLKIRDICEQEKVPYYPTTVEEFRLLRQNISRSLDKGNLQHIVVDADNYISRVLTDFCIDHEVLFLVDDELKEGSVHVTGIAFYKKFQRFITLLLFISSYVWPWRSKFKETCATLGFNVLWKDDKNYPYFPELLPKLQQIKETRETKVS